MAARTSPPFRADHVGSLLRPPALVRAREEAAAGGISAGRDVDGRLGLAETIFGDDFAFLRETVTAAVPKLTIPSPSMVHYRGGRASIDPEIYPDLDGFWSDLTAAYREEVRRLGELG